MKSTEEDDVQSTDRRDFLVQAALAVAGISAAAAALPASASATASEKGSSVSLQKPISWRLLKSDTKKDGAVKESSGIIELTGSNGVRYVSDCYSRRIDREGGHEDLVLMRTDQYSGPSDSTHVRSDSRTIITSTQFGELRDGVRMDKVTVQVADETGRKAYPPMTVKVPVPNPYSGLSDQELLDKILSEKLGPK
jgi:Ubiquitinol-cytochrome C reductase Fe-S subunit TAT signal